jgi:hypothetical protein
MTFASISNSVMSFFDCLVNGIERFRLADWADLAVIVSAIFAFLVIYHGNKNHKKKATSDYMNANIFENESSRKGDMFLKMLFEGVDFADLCDVCHTNDDTFQKRQVVIWKANFWETFAVGIDQGLYDEVYAFQYFRSSLINDWRVLEPFIHKVSDGDFQYYYEFRKLAQRWNAVKPFHERNLFRRWCLPITLSYLKYFPPSLWKDKQR